MTEQSTSDVKEEIEYQTFSEFLESNPPNQVVEISNISEVKHEQHRTYSIMSTPQLQLHCEHDNCNGISDYDVNGQLFSIFRTPMKAISNHRV